MNKRDKEADKKRFKVAKGLYRRLFGRPFPKNWHIYWHVQGHCIFEWAAIYLAGHGLTDPYDLTTLVHEFVHLTYPEKRHGKAFDLLVRKLTKEAKLAINDIRKEIKGGKGS